MTVSTNPVLGAKVLAPYILAKSNVPAARNSANAAGDSTEATLATITLPAGLLSGSTSIFVYALFRATGSASTKSYYLRLGGTSFGQTTSTTNPAVQLNVVIHADNAANDQKLPNNVIAGFTGNASAMIDGSKDCSVPIDITFGCHWNAATLSETITLESYMVVVYPGQ